MAGFKSHNKINVTENDSWFRGHPHHWATASLPLAYAVACVEVVSKESNEAGAVYQQLVEAWGNPGLKTIYEAIIAEVPDSEIEKTKNIKCPDWRRKIGNTKIHG